MIELELPQINAYLAQKQGFAPAKKSGKSKLLDPDSPRLLGIYGSAPTCYLSIIARVPGCTVKQIDEHIYQRRSLVRFRVMRGALFLVQARHVPTVIQASK